MENGARATQEANLQEHVMRKHRVVALTPTVLPTRIHVLNVRQCHLERGHGLLTPITVVSMLLLQVNNGDEALNLSETSGTRKLADRVCKGVKGILLEEVFLIPSIDHAAKS